MRKVGMLRGMRKVGMVRRMMRMGMMYSCWCWTVKGRSEGRERFEWCRVEGRLEMVRRMGMVYYWRWCRVEGRVEMRRDLVRPGRGEGRVRQGSHCWRDEVCLVQAGGTHWGAVGWGDHWTSSGNWSWDWSLVERIVKEYRYGWM